MTIIQSAAARAIVAGDHDDPFSYLGLHARPAGGLVARAFLPRARRLWIIDAGSGETVAEYRRVESEGLFEAEITGRDGPFPYRLRIEADHGTFEAEDPYRFPPVLGDLDVHLLGEGNHLRMYETLGAHPRTMEGVDGVAFAVWAPNARRVSVVGPFNDWDGRRLPMRLRHACGVWEMFVPGIGPGALYKYEIKDRFGNLLPLKADPVGFAAESPPSTASVVAVLDRRPWPDEAWMAGRAALSERGAPITIYEVHLGSWKRKVEEGGRYLGYRELAHDLVPYAKDMGFTHLELMPVSEYPFDGSWGYQPIGLYAPTSRFGIPADFRYFVECCHAAGLGLLIDWVPGHFPTDPHGLGWFDGTHLYEHADPRKGRHIDWDTLIYNYGRREVANYLLANALFWLREYHIDGLRVDAVASMLYLDYSRQHGEWIPNIYGGNENLEAIAFLKRINELAYGEAAGVFTAAEESTAWPMVSRPTYLGGLGFGYKWNMGWMHDTLRYISKDPVHRRYHHNDLTFGLLYAFTENFILPLSHDEVVHGKGSLLGRMPGDRWQRFANLRAYFGFMFTHPGKKLLFMGGEFAQESEWRHDHSLDWHLLDDSFHSGMQRLVRDLNHLYRQTPALHQRDCEGDGFEWIDAQDADNSTLSYLRKGRDEKLAVIVCNFTPVVRHDYRVGVPVGGFYREVLNTDGEAYGGGGVGNAGGRQADAVPFHGRPYSLNLVLPPLATIVLESPG